MVYEVVAFQALRDQLKCKEIWVVGADEWRNPDEDLPQDFAERGEETTASWRKPMDPQVFIDKLRVQMTTELKLLNDQLPKLGWLDIAERKSGAIRLTPAEAQPEPRNLRRPSRFRSGSLARMPGIRERRAERRSQKSVSTAQRSRVGLAASSCWRRSRQPREWQGCPPGPRCGRLAASLPPSLGQQGEEGCVVSEELDGCLPVFVDAAGPQQIGQSQGVRSGERWQAAAGGGGDGAAQVRDGDAEVDEVTVEVSAVPGGALWGAKAGELLGELVGRLGESGVGQAHAPTSRMRLRVASSVSTRATCSSKKAPVKAGGWKKVIRNSEPAPLATTRAGTCQDAWYST